MITYHANGSNVRLRTLIVDGLGSGVTGQVPTVTIRRRSDGLYWGGGVWGSFQSSIMTEESAGNLPGSYYFDFDHTAAGGEANEYLVRYTNSAPPPLRGLDEEQHCFRAYASSLVPERRLGHALADDGVTLRVTLWIEEGGQRVTDYSSISVVVKDGRSSTVITLGTDTTDTADGLFSFETPISAIVRNLPYVLIAAAVRGGVTDTFNAGFVRV